VDVGRGMGVASTSLGLAVASTVASSPSSSARAASSSSAGVASMGIAIAVCVPAIISFIICDCVETGLGNASSPATASEGPPEAERVHAPKRALSTNKVPAKKIRFFLMNFSSRDYFP